jgi:carbon-monoxide dehydrogenase large subunit
MKLVILERDGVINERQPSDANALIEGSVEALAQLHQSGFTVIIATNHGGLAQGIGQAMWEQVIYDEYGNLVTSSFVDYLVPTAPDLPPIETGRLVTPAPSNPLGAKGTGESGCIGAPPAIVNAVIDALAPYGVTDLSMPLAPSTVWQALQKARGLGPAER